MLAVYRRTDIQTDTRTRGTGRTELDENIAEQTRILFWDLGV